MRVASICDTCASYINAACIIYNGDYLAALNVSPLDSLDDILQNINNSLNAQSGAGSPSTQIPKYLGQEYIDTNGFVWIGLSTTLPNWGLIGSFMTTTTTTTAVPTTTTTTTT